MLLKVTAKRIAAGKWGCNNGQACIAPDYIITTQSFAPKLVKNWSSTAYSKTWDSGNWLCSGSWHVNIIGSCVPWAKSWRSSTGRTRCGQRICRASWTPTISIDWRRSWMMTWSTTRSSSVARVTNSSCEWIFDICLMISESQAWLAANFLYHFLLCRSKIAPTLLLDVPLDSAIMKEEIFGPLLPIITVNITYPVIIMFPRIKHTEPC